MEVQQKGHTTIIKDTKGTLDHFIRQLTDEYKMFENVNIIADISIHKNLTKKEINAFLPLAKAHKKAKKSFVIVVENFDFNSAGDKLVVVPSILEAHDIIEMDEIERDLGF
jgi:hypothetical protein